jgi:hypothetical protein
LIRPSKRRFAAAFSSPVRKDDRFDFPCGEEATFPCSGFTLVAHKRRRERYACGRGIQRRERPNQSSLRTIFRSRAIADERSRRTREQRERRYVKTRFPLDSAAGFARCRLTGTKN